MTTLSNLKTDKDVFDYATSFLYNQNDISITDEYACAYRGLKGMKCAIGCVIDDQFYHHTLENCTVYDANVQKAIMQSLPSYEINEDFLNYMQYVHDKHSTHNWKSQFALFQFSQDGRFEKFLGSKAFTTNGKG